jgi:hypothetical protein
MRIEFGEYAIRDWSGGDAGAIARYANNPNVAIWLRDRFPCPYRLSDAKVFLGKVARQNPQTVFAIATPSHVFKKEPVSSSTNSP